MPVSRKKNPPRTFKSNPKAKVQGMDSLKAVSERHHEIERALYEQNRKLKERIKELNCLYNISWLVDRGGLEYVEIVHEVVKLIPTAWQYPEITKTKIIIEDRTFQSHGFQNTPWRQECNILLDEQEIGSITVCYVEERPHEHEGPFLLEERALIIAISQFLGRMVGRIRAKEKLLKEQEKLRNMTASLAMSEQRERRLIAEALHDRIGQTLAMINIKLGTAMKENKNPATETSLHEIRKMIGEVLSETRTLTFELFPPVLYELGLGAAIGWLVERYEGEYGLKIKYSETGDWKPMPEELSVTLFQAARELLTNVVKHARAKKVSIDLTRREKDIHLSVQDYGKGFRIHEGKPITQSQDGFGLFNIKERIELLGGNLKIETDVRSGTNVIITVPDK